MTYIHQIEALVCTVAAAARHALDVESCLLFVFDSSGEQLWSLSDAGEIVTRTIGVGLVGRCAAYNQVRPFVSSFPRDFPASCNLHALLSYWFQIPGLVESS
jgi:hypothetical protein